MKMRRDGSGWGGQRPGVRVIAVLVLVLTGFRAYGEVQQGSKAPAQKQRGGCERVVLQGEVNAGEGFQRMFAKGLVFSLEALKTGWIVRILPVDGPRPVHDWAELASPPYSSVTPLLISTDFAFRAQDAVGWNPRRFRFAASANVANQLSGLYPAVMAGNAAAAGRVAELSSQQPEVELQILNARIVPGTADQWRVAAAVAQHFSTTPHEVEQGTATSPLGALKKLGFRVKLQLPQGMAAAPGEQREEIPCAARPTG